MQRKAALAIFVTFLAACGEQQEEAFRPPAAPDDPGVVHIHGLGRNPADGSLMIATHTGLFRVAKGAKEPIRVGGNYQDTMGFAVTGPDRFLGSGHPGSGDDDPPFLGLIESDDAGKQWKPISLRGEADFHVLEARGRTVYGFGSDYESQEARFLRSEDGGRAWKRLAPPEALLALAIDPADAAHVVALGEQRGWVSEDGGERWRPLALPGGLVTWTERLGLVAVDAQGIVRRASEPSDDWEEVGTLDGTPAALEGVGEELLAATHDARVLSSVDGGRSWRAILNP